jgi:hypothetical protein
MNCSTVVRDATRAFRPVAVLATEQAFPLVFAHRVEVRDHRGVSIKAQQLHELLDRSLFEANCFAQLLAHDLGQLDVTVFDRAVKWVGLANVQLRVLENADDHARDVDAGY